MELTVVRAIDFSPIKVIINNSILYSIAGYSRIKNFAHMSKHQFGQFFISKSLYFKVYKITLHDNVM